MLLSIMIPTTIDRTEMFAKLVTELRRQIAPYNNTTDPDLQVIEILAMTDNKEMSVGKKRNLLLKVAAGDYVVGIDSDDWVSKDYIDKIIHAIKDNPGIDHIGFYEHCSVNGVQSMSRFTILDPEWGDLPDGMHMRCANPKSVIRREIAQKVGFEDIRFGEDHLFSQKVTPLCKTEVFIDKVLYYYRHVSTPHNERYGIKE